MNSATTTGATAVTSAMLAGVIIWLCGVVHISPPPVEVAGTIGAALLYGAHVLANLISRPVEDSPVPTPTPPVTQPTTPTP